MSLTNTTKMANRFGLNIKFYPYTPDGSIGPESQPVATVDFANEVSIELSADLTWATGGQAHSKMIGFKNPTEGTLSISTQIVTMTLLSLAAGGDVASAGNKVSFMNDKAVVNPTYYIIKGETLWQGEDGTTYSETITAYKACVKPGYKATYNGEGDPQALDIEFELGTNDSGMVLDIERSDGGGSEP